MNTSFKYIKVTAKAGGTKESVTMKGDRYIVTVKEPAQDGRANDALVKVLAKHLGVSEKKIVLVRGSQKPSKLFICYEA